MKLKCDNHNRRVLSVSTNPSFIHRTGDGSKCDSKTASLTDTRSKTKRTFVVMAQKDDPKTFDLASISTNKEY